MFDKYGNDLDYWYYCPICADSKLPSFRVCPIHKKTALVKSKYPMEYYRNKQPELSFQKSAYQILWEEEIIKNPLYDRSQDKFYIRLQQQKKEMELYKKKKSESIPIYAPKPLIEQQCTPKCPTCQSTNIKKISVTKKVTHGLMFGILSKTAFSQFECCNCGYKW